MKKLTVLIFVFVVFISCNEKRQQNFSGDLNIPDAIFNYSAIGQGIPCILFAGAENLDKNLLPEEFLEHFNVIGANPDHVFIPRTKSGSEDNNRAGNPYFTVLFCPKPYT